ncbi:MAG: aminotransferase class I/II-fold pyridoxal phosphate-dependent enzyme [Rikenellaceae bacterium]
MTKSDVKRLVRPNILALEPYSTARDEYEGGEIDVWLDANENPFDNGINRYPDPHQVALKKQLAQIKGVAPQSIFIGNGSDEAIDLMFRVFARPAVDNAVSIAPTYGMYRVAAATNDIEMREVQLGENFELPVAELLAAADENTKLMWICSPNNPTGNSFAKSDIVELLTKFRGVVIVDEAYIDFATEGGLLSELANYENLIVLQTLSKAWGMAGLRFGLAFASREVIGLMNRVKYPYNIGVLTQAKVAEQLKKGVAEQVAEILNERTKVVAALEAMSLEATNPETTSPETTSPETTNPETTNPETTSTVERVYPTEANFVLIKVAAADALYDALVAEGVIVRNRSRVKGCANTLRLTIGTAAENERMLAVIKDFKGTSNNSPNYF